MAEKCAGCGKELSGSILSAMDKKWHPECFVCSKCSGSLQEGFGVVDGQPVCKTCAGQLNSGPSKPCWKCGEPLSGACINAMGHTFHKDCFVCNDCGGDISGGFATIDEHPYCKTCATKKQQSSQPSQICGECGLPLSGSCINSNGTIFHADCFKCHSCKKKLGTGGCKLIDGHPHCEDCAKKLTKRTIQNPCDKCGEELSGSCVKALGKTFHTDCFKCCVCKSNLQAGFKYDKIDSDLWFCSDCYPKRPGACPNCQSRKSGGQFCGNCGQEVWSVY